MKRQPASPEADWFPETFPPPCRAFRNVLDDPSLVKKIAMIRCAAILSPHLRGDGKKAGWSVIINGLPSSFPVEISHDDTIYLAELARIAPPKKTRSVRFTPPCEMAIAEAMREIYAAQVARMTEAIGICLKGMNLSEPTPPPPAP